MATSPRTEWRLRDSQGSKRGGWKAGDGGKQNVGRLTETSYELHPSACTRQTFLTSYLALQTQAISATRSLAIDWDHPRDGSFDPGSLYTV